MAENRLGVVVGIQDEASIPLARIKNQLLSLSGQYGTKVTIETDALDKIRSLRNEGKKALKEYDRIEAQISKASNGEASLKNIEENYHKLRNTLRGYYTAMLEMRGKSSGLFAIYDLDGFQKVSDIANKYRDILRNGTSAEIERSLREKSFGELNSLLNAFRAEFDKNYRSSSKGSRWEELGFPSKKDYDKAMQDLVRFRTAYTQTLNEIFKPGQKPNDSLLKSFRTDLQQQANEVKALSQRLDVRPGIDMKAIENYDLLKQRLKEVKEWKKEVEAEFGKSSLLKGGQFNDIKRYIDEANRALKSTEGTKNILNSDKFDRAKKAYLRGTSEIRNAVNNLDKTFDTTRSHIRALEQELEKTQKTLGRGSVRSMMIQELINQLKIYEQQIQAAKNKQENFVASVTSRKLGISAGDTVAVGNVSTLARQAAELNKHIQQQRNSWADANAAAQKYGAEIDRISGKLSQQGVLANDLKSQLAGMYGIYQVQNFLKNLIDIGGQFEYQRASIGKILGDASKANAIFNEVKQLALSSPFNTLELDQNIKQLSAFNVEYHELYGTLKMLGDVAAATGTELSRLTYAYGHVKSQGFMNAMQMRMFTNANVPMLPELAKLYSEREGRTVTRDQIYARLKQRDVDAADVEEVFRRLAGPGGKFENMQEVMGNTVKGVWKNLGDAINHMYMDIESQQKGVLMGTGKTLTMLVNNMKELVPYIKTAVTTYAAWKLAIYGVTIANGQQMTSTFAAMAALNKEEAMRIRQVAMYRKLTATETEYIALTKVLTAAQVKRAMAAGKLTEAQVYQAISAGKLSIREAILLARQGMITREGIRSALAMRTFTGQISLLMTRMKGFGVAASASFGKFFTMLKGISFSSIATGFNNVFGAIGRGALMAGTAVKSLLASFGPMLALMGAFEAFTYFSNKKEERRQGLEDFKNADRDTRSSIEQVTVQYKADFSQMNAEDLKSVRDELETAVRDNLAASERILAEVYAKDSNGMYLKKTAEQCKMMYDALESARKASKDLEDNGVNAAGGFDEASKNTYLDGGNYSNSVSKNLKKVEKDAKKVQVALATMTGPANKAMKDYLATLGKGDKEFAKINKDNLYQQMIYLSEIGKLNAEMWSGHNFGNNNKEIGGAKYSEFIGRIEDIRAQIPLFEKELGEALDKLDVNQYQQKLYEWMTATLKIGPETSKALSKWFAEEKFGIPVTANVSVDTKEAKNKLQSWMRVLEKDLTAKEYVTEIRASADIPDALEKCKKIYDAAKKRWDQLVKMAPSFQIKVNFDSAFTNTKAFRESLLLQLKMARQNYKMAKEANGGKSNAETQRIGAQIDYLKELIGDYEKVSAKDFLEDEKKTKTKKNGGNKGYDRSDPALKEWQNRMKQIEEVRTTYEDLVKTFGREEGMKKLLSENSPFRKIIEELFPDKAEIFENKKITEINFSNAYKELAGEIEGMKNPKDFGKFTADEKKQLEEARKAAQADANQKAERSLNLFVRIETAGAIKDIEQFRKDMQKKFDMFDKMYEATGDKAFAMSFAGLSENTSLNKAKRAEDFLKQEIDKANKNAKEKAEKSNIDIPDLLNLDKIIKMTDSEIENLPEEVKSAYRSWREELESLSRANQDTLTQMLQQQKDYATEVARIEAERARKQAVIDALYAKDPEKHAQFTGINNASTNLKLLEMSAGYQNFAKDSIALGFKTVGAQYSRIINELNNAFRTGVISAAEYTKRVKEADDVVYKKRSTLFATHNLTGLRDLRRAQYDTAVRDFEESNTKVQKADASPEAWAEWFERWTNMEDAEDRKEKAEKLTAKFGKMSDVVAMVTGGLQAFKEIFEQFSALFASYGNREAADKMSNFADGIGGVMAGLEPIGNMLQSAMSGDVAGLVSNAIMAPFKLVMAPWTAFNELHDKKLSQQIEYLKTASKADAKHYAKNEETEKKTMDILESELPKIQRQFERGFGRQSDNTADRLKNLRDQKDLLQQQLGYEYDKKNPDSAALIEYRDKIDELEDQIKYFAADLAKELYGIDLKGWADQLGDSLMTAFRNGEDAALAWKRTVGDIMRDIASQQMKLFIQKKIMEPIFDDFFTEGGEYYFGDNLENLETNLPLLMSRLNGALTPELLDSLEAYSRSTQKTTPDSSDSAGSGGLSKIGQSLTEDTGSLIASYINAIRQDVSYNRSTLESMNLAMYAEGQSIATIADSQLQQLRMIQQDVHFMTDYVVGVHEHLYEIKNMFDAATNGSGVRKMSLE